MDDEALVRAHSHHEHQFGSLVHAYPVLSRRAGGISLGVNLNLDKACNFACPYCQVDRAVARGRLVTDPALVRRELSLLLDAWEKDRLQPLFPGVLPEHLRLNDIALSGDGESTMDPSFAAVCKELARLQSERRKLGFRLVLITNATLLDRPAVREGIEELCRIDGEVWGKLDAGTEESYREVSVSRVPFSRILKNLAWAAGAVPLRIQTLFFRRGDREPSFAETQAWIERLREVQAGGAVRSVQLHTVARRTAVADCHPLPLAWLEELAGRVRARTGLVVDCFAGVEPPQEGV
jgi:pyruvate-formate lyase-activating enzyme